MLRETKDRSDTSYSYTSWIVVVVVVVVVVVTVIVNIISPLSLKDKIKLYHLYSSNIQIMKENTQILLGHTASTGDTKTK